MQVTGDDFDVEISYDYLVIAMGRRLATVLLNGLSFIPAQTARPYKKCFYSISSLLFSTSLFMFIKELTTEECLGILNEKRVGRLACARENQPYVVPFHFVFDGGKHFYAFSTLGQKIEWMRTNPLVCVEVDDIKNQFEWTSLVVFGRYEELPDTPEFAAVRNRAYELLSRHSMWWQPAYVVGAHRAPAADEKPIYFRIFITTITGHRAVSDETS